MVSDEEIVNGIESLLQDSDPNSVVTSLNGVVQQLEAKLGLDLSHKAGFIRDLFARLPLPLTPQPQQSKDHFAILPQFHNNAHSHFPPSSHFAPSHHYPPPGELNFRYPPPQPQHYPYPCSHPYQQPLRSPTSYPPNVGRKDASLAAASKPEIKKKSASAGTKRRGGPGGLNKVCGVSPQLQAVVGEPALPRTQIVKQLWAYIRKHNLQDPSNKRKINCNEALRLVFETDCTDMFKMNKLLAKHIIPLDPTKEPGSDTKRVKVEMESATESTEAASEAASEVSLEAASEVTLEADSEVALEAAAEVDSSTVIISDALARFFGTEVREMPQSEAVRRIWEYIKVNQLEDHLNPMMIMCDFKLQELFGCENISALGIAEMLMSHIFKQL